MSKRDNYADGPGYTLWTPTWASQWERLRQIHLILRQQRAYLPISPRRIYYLMAGKDWASKGEIVDGMTPAEAKAAQKKAANDANNIANTVKWARRSTVPGVHIPWHWISDDKVAIEANYKPANLGEALGTVWDWASRHARDVQQDQERRVIVVCEAKGALDIVNRVASKYTAPVQSSGGTDGLKPKRDIVQRSKRWDTDAVILHITDYDIGGQVMRNAPRDDVLAFAAKDCPHLDVEHRVVALTEPQIHENALITHPQKPDNREPLNWHGVNGDTRVACELEAMDPVLLVDILDAEFQSILDMDLVEEHRAEAEREQDELKDLLRPLLPDDFDFGDEDEDEGDE